MKFPVVLLPLLLGLLPTTNTPTRVPLTVREADSSTILNYDESLGGFRDLTKEEVKDYYADLSSKDGIRGDELLAGLQPILRNNHKKLSNSTAWSTGWELFLLLDRDYASDPLTEEEISSQEWKTDNVIVNPLYTDDETWVKSETRYFDREHMWPKSRGFKDKYVVGDTGSERPYAATDMHNLRMAEHNNNSSGHNNHPYGKVADKTSSKTTALTSQYTNQVTGYRGLNEDGITVYEPRDEDKGDIARGLFYMAARYHTYVSTEDFEPALRLVSEFESNSVATASIVCEATKDTPATYGILEDLLEWHRLDPVDEYEIHRNNLCFNLVQGNRNPFVDYPEWADVCFGNVDYGIDLDNENGLESTIAGDDVFYVDYSSWEVHSLEIGSEIDFSTLELGTYLDDGSTSPLTLENVTYTVRRNGVELTIEDGKLALEEGSYEIVLTYLDEDGAPHEARIAFEITKVEEPVSSSSSEVVTPPEEPETPSEPDTLPIDPTILYIAIGIGVLLLLVLTLVFGVKIKKKKSKKGSKKGKSKKKKQSKTK